MKIRENDKKQTKIHNTKILPFKLQTEEDKQEIQSTQSPGHVSVTSK